VAGDREESGIRYAPQEESRTIMSDGEHDHTPEEERRIREAALDETIADSFPASDPPSTIPNPDDDEALENQKAEELPPD
jgi:hypothetical protein